jgi:excisionase family DNA binding protein
MNPDQARPVRIVLTIEEAAERLGIGRTLMYAPVSAGEVESVRIGRLRRIPTDALDTYVRRLRALLASSGPEAA